MKKVVTFGEIMLRLATPDYLRFCQATEFTATFGGGEANVAVSLANYGLKPEFVTRVPKNDIAESCLKELHKYGVGTVSYTHLIGFSGENCKLCHGSRGGLSDFLYFWKGFPPLPLWSCAERPRHHGLGRWFPTCLLYTSRCV